MGPFFTRKRSTHTQKIITSAREFMEEIRAYRNFGGFSFVSVVEMFKLMYV